MERRHKFGAAAALALTMLAAASSAPLAESQQEILIDRPGGDYRNFELPPAGPEVCEQACQAEGQCRAWTWVRAGVQGVNARCWLKNTVPDPQSADCCISGVVRPLAADEPGEAAVDRTPYVATPLEVAQVRQCVAETRGVAPSAAAVLSEMRRRARAAGERDPELTLKALDAWLRDATVLACKRHLGIPEDAQ